MNSNLSKIILTVGAAALFGACGGGANPSGGQTDGANRPAAASPAPANAAPAAQTDAEIPAAVRAALGDAQSVTKQRSELPAAKAAAIQKDAGGTEIGREHVVYLGFATRDGRRTQIGGATVLKVEGREAIVVYDSRDGMPTVREVRADFLPKEFLAQFAGKNHDAKIKFGEDVKALGADEQLAKALTTAVRIDVLTMEAIYGKEHSH